MGNTRGLIVCLSKISISDVYFCFKPPNLSSTLTLDHSLVLKVYTVGADLGIL